MNLEDQLDLDFTVARRRARLGRLKELVLRRGTRSTLPSPEELGRSVPARGRMYRGSGRRGGGGRGWWSGPALEPPSPPARDAAGAFRLAEVCTGAGGRSR